MDKNIQISGWANKGFTLLEMSIVMTIIGLLIGGVMAGQELVNAARVRGQITQIQQYQTAVRFFNQKFQALPGDISAKRAAQFGFTARGPYEGQGDGNGILEGIWVNLPYYNRSVPLSGEMGMFWVDLTTANGLNLNLVPGNFQTANPLMPPECSYAITPNSSPMKMGDFMPEARIGRGNYIYVYSSGTFVSGLWIPSSINYFGLSPTVDVDCMGDMTMTPTMAIKVSEAYQIDSKIDDGLPQSGSVQAFILAGNGTIWTSGTTSTSVYGATNNTAAVPGSITTCYDDSISSSGTPGVIGAPMHYSMEIKKGIGLNCGLSFQFQ